MAGGFVDCDRLGRFTKGVLAGIANTESASSPKLVTYHLQCCERYIRDVQETILILVLLVDAAHECGGGWQNLVDEDEDRLLRAELDALADHVDELAHRQVGGDQVLLLVDGRDVALLHLFADHLVGGVSGDSQPTFNHYLPECGLHISGVCDQLQRVSSQS